MEDLNQVACLFLTGIHSYDDWTLDTHSDKGESFTIPRMVTALPDEGRSPRSRKSIASADNEHGSPEHDENQISLRPTLRRAATDLAKLLEEYNPLRLKSITRQNTQQPLISGLSVSLFFNWLTSSSANTGDGNGVGASEDKGSPGSEFRGTGRFLVGLYVGHRAGIATSPDDIGGQTLRLPFQRERPTQTSKLTSSSDGRIKKGRPKARSAPSGSPLAREISRSMAEALVGQIRAGDAASTLDPYLAEDVGQTRWKRGFSRQRKAQGGTPAAGHL
ncbi:hypothetical protein M430DRAFT_45576 [Amorphotheca resinae ATCC 22711]|uniref:Uncharacterized protein n=1 Tax=Amorphotheca resinae ATCC 22711 TaxID=857342 RepID=A0A2T3AQY3_AMORE|nr:hypothetical protein M430DRAFT_45576 [Amorphotheca resinae ATCC 22711]PSS08642.1 hypothetical protein M430DRAFT_45576 [Amorphotheca resinae ATCC 22711]